MRAEREDVMNDAIDGGIRYALGLNNGGGRTSVANVLLDAILDRVAQGGGHVEAGLLYVHQRGARRKKDTPWILYVRASKRSLENTVVFGLYLTTESGCGNDDDDGLQVCRTNLGWGGVC